MEEREENNHNERLEEVWIMINESDIQQRLYGPGMFRCERWLCQMSIDNCLKRQNKPLEGYPRPASSGLDMAFPECQECLQGLENRQRAAQGIWPRPDRGEIRPKVVVTLFEKVGGPSRRPVEQKGGTRPLKARQAVFRVGILNNRRKALLTGPAAKSLNTSSSGSRTEDGSASR